MNTNETAFDRNSVNNKAQQAVFIEWYNLSYIFTDLLTDLLCRPVRAESAREEYYYWKITLGEPITPEELEVLFEQAKASEYDREINAFTDGFPIMELCQGVCSKMMNKLLPFNLVLTRADDDGVWFIGEELEDPLSAASSEKVRPFPNVYEKSLPDGSALAVRTGGDPNFPGIYIYLRQPDGAENDDLLCVAEFNTDRSAGKEICICAYAHNLDEPAYYASYYDDGTPCGIV